MANKQAISLNVNGEQHTLTVDPSMPLLYALRNNLGLTAAKFGCGLEQCGACAVLVDGRSTLSCSTPVASFTGRDIVTCEGLGTSTLLGDVQRAFVQAGVGQCGYCIPGLVVATTALIADHRCPDAEQITQALRPHLCRCGSHARVLSAIAGVIEQGMALTLEAGAAQVSTPPADRAGQSER